MDELYKCEKCNLNYKTSNGLWKHKNKYHKNEKNPDDNDGKPFKCKYCNTTFTRKNNMNMHIKNICKEKKNEIQELKDQVTKLSTEINEMKGKNKSSKTINNTINNTMTNSNNKTINIVINKYGSENLFELSQKEIMDLLEINIKNILYYLEFVNFNKNRPQNHSYCVTALNSEYISVIDNESNKINKSNKKHVFDNLLNYGVKNITKLYNSNKDIIPHKKRKIIEENIEQLITYQMMPYNKCLKKKLVKSFNTLAYNNKDMVLDTWKRREKIEDDECENLFINEKEEDNKNLTAKELSEKYLKDEKKLLKEYLNKKYNNCNSSSITDSDSEDEKSNNYKKQKYSDSSDESDSSEKVELKLVKPTNYNKTNDSSASNSEDEKPNKIKKSNKKIKHHSDTDELITYNN
jgi:hypothetical protein